MSLPHKHKKTTSAFVFFVVLFSMMFGMNNKHYDATANKSVVNPRQVYVSGMPIGLEMQSNGVIVTGYLGFMNEKNEFVNPGMDAGIMIGDRIVAISGKTVNSTQELQSCVAKSNGICVLDIVRNKANHSITMTPDISVESHNFKLGLWVKDNTAGIGTLTFIDTENMAYGALGHGIGDCDSESLFELSGGTLYTASIANVIPGRMGAPGELQGYFLEPESDGIGNIYLNDERGVYGSVTQSTADSAEKYGVLMPVDDGTVIHEGCASIITTVSGNLPKLYNIEITSVPHNVSCEIKNISIRVTDEELLSKTGGIVQGMSGSPIIQDGYVVGAVTHVYVRH